jgi:hypothetical protein
LCGWTASEVPVELWFVWEAGVIEEDVVETDVVEGAVVEVDVVEVDAVEGVVTAAKFQPLTGMPLIWDVVVRTEVIVTHTVAPAERVTTVTVCPGVTDDWHCPTEPRGDTPRKSYWL